MRIQLIVTLISLLHTASLRCMDLMKAIHQQDRGAVSTALTTGSNPNLCKNGKPSPLTLAVMYDNAEIVQLLVTHKADVNAHDKLGYLANTPLGAAAANGNAKLVESLLSCGANPNIHKDPFWSPFVYAVDKRDVASAQLLVDHGANTEILTQNWDKGAWSDKHRAKMEAVLTMLKFPTKPAQVTIPQPKPTSSTQTSSDTSAPSQNVVPGRALFSSCFDICANNKKDE